MELIPMGKAPVNKELIEVSSGRFAEVIYFNRPEKQVICFSTQLNCAVGCDFCASPGTGPTINLSADEMLAQVHHMLKQADPNKLMLFSIMGEGEPLLNYKNVMEVMHELPSLHKECKISLSTSGAAPDKIKRLAEVEFDVPFKLQVSIHAIGPGRKKLMPQAKSINEIKYAIEYYHHKKPDAPVELNFTLLKGVNDSYRDAKMICDYFREEYIKISKFNTVIDSHHKSSDDSTIDAFVQYLRDRGLTVEYHQTDGSDVSAACGQTRGMALWKKTD